MRRAACAEQLAEQLPQRNSRRATCTEHFAQLAQSKLHKALVQSNLRAGHVPKQLLRAYVRACVRAVAFFCWFVCVCACVCVCVCVCASCGSVRACVNEERTVTLVFLSGKSCSFFWQMGVGARTASSGSSQFPQPPRGSQGQSATARSTDGLRSPCDRQPHCANWRRHENDSKLGLEKKLQYLFLYAAEARSLTCMRHYVEVAHAVLGSCLLFFACFLLANLSLAIVSWFARLLSDVARSRMRSPPGPRQLWLHAVPAESRKF